VFASDINKSIIQTESFYESTNYRDALQSGFHYLQTARDNYRYLVGKKGMKKDLVLRFIEVQAIIMAPIIPHFSECIWKLLGKSGSVRKSAWPTAGTVDEGLLAQKDYLFTVAHTFRLRKDLQKFKSDSKSQSPTELTLTKATVFVAASYPEWKQKILTTLKVMFEQNNTDEKEISKVLSADNDLKKVMKKVMPFVATVKEQYVTQGKSALELKLPFDEKAFMESQLDFLTRTLELTELQVKYADEDLKEKSSPGQPMIQYE